MLYNSHMATTTIRVPTEVHSELQRISKEKGISIQEATTQAVETYRRQQLLDAANAAYEILRRDPEASKAYDNDPLDWDNTLSDDIEDY